MRFHPSGQPITYFYCCCALFLIYLPSETKAETAVLELLFISPFSAKYVPQFNHTSTMIFVFIQPWSMTKREGFVFYFKLLRYDKCLFLLHNPLVSFVMARYFGNMHCFTKTMAKYIIQANTNFDVALPPSPFSHRCQESVFADKNGDDKLYAAIF